MTTQTVPLSINAAYDKVFTDFIGKLGKKKTVLETCSTIQLVDDNGRLITIYYRTLEGCANPQTDTEETFYDVEQVTYQDRRVKLSSRGERLLLEWLYLKNPEKI